MHTTPNTIRKGTTLCLVALLTSGGCGVVSEPDPFPPPPASDDGAAGGSGGASDSGGVSTAPTGPGRFGLTMLQGMGAPREPGGESLAKPSRARTRRFALTTEATFELGDLKASQEFYFLLQNTGGTPITDITLAAEGEGFEVIPQRIEALAPGGAAGGDFLPVVRVAINHGVALNGVGYTELLPQGAVTGGLAIAGATTAADEPAEGEGEGEGEAGSETVELNVALTATARVLDIDLTCGGQVVALGTSSDGGTTTLGGLGFIKGYRCPAPGSITNTGNVDLEIKNFHADGSLWEILGAAAPGESIDLPLGTGYALRLGLDGDNTVTDPSKLQIGSDGLAYLQIEAPMPPEEEPPEEEEGDPP